jgi:hypothetical protein
LAVAAGVVGLRLLLGATLSPEGTANVYRAAWWIALCVAAGALAPWLAGRRAGLAPLLLVALTSVDLLSLNQGRFLVSNPPAPDQVALLANAPAGADPFYRVAADQISGQDFGSVTGRDMPNGKSSLALRGYDRLLAAVDLYRRNILLNVEVVATTGSFADAAYTPASDYGDFHYYNFLPAHPRAYLVQHVQAAADEADAAAQIAVPGFDHWNTALVVNPPALDDTQPLGPAEGATITGRTANTLALTVQADVPRLLVIANAAYPGWRAWIDGAPAPLLTTNVALQGLVVPAGGHTVTLRFQPVTLNVGGVISLIAWLGGLVALFLATRTARRPPTVRTHAAF